MARLLTSMLALAVGSSACAAGTQVLSVTGQVERLQGDQTVALRQGEALDGAFGLRSGADGRAQIVLDDGSILTLVQGSEVALSAAPKRQVKLLSGGLNLLSGKGYQTIEAMGYVLKTDGYLRLRQCAQACTEIAGLYGRPVSGEVIVEYTGGRAVLRSKPFRAAVGATRPVILAREPESFADDRDLEPAARAKLALADEIKVGMQAFKSGQFETARGLLQSVLEKSPTEKIVTYYLGLTALELKDNDAALKYLQQYTRDDPDAARERGVGQLVTLLLTNQLQGEVALAIQQESVLTREKPEPNSIAVQAFTNRGDPTYAALAKGIAAMVITDLSKVPGLKVLERQKVQKLTDEVQLGESGLVSQESLVRAGRLMKAEKVVVGSFGVQ